MAHLIETMAYANETPWHGLGNSLSPDSSIETWQQAAGLDWTVSKRAVEFGVGLSDPHVFKDKFVLARDSDHKPYSVVSGRYKPVQPKEILEFFRDLVQMHGMQIETAGALKDGQRIWALAKTGEVHKVLGVDQVDGYLLLATSYDGSFSTLAQFTSVRVVCNNTLQMAFKDYTGRISIPHFRAFDAEAIKAEMGIGREAWTGYGRSLDVLAKLRLDVTKATQVMEKVFDMAGAEPKTASVGALHVAKVIDLFSGRAIGADIAGKTGWGLLNGLTEYVDKHKRARNQGNRLDSAWFGEGALLKQRALDELLALAA
jgi:phage/plasmid-like protein (TIGR03299 family)